MVFLLLGTNALKSVTAFVLESAMLVGDSLPAETVEALTTKVKSPKQWVEFFSKTRAKVLASLRLIKQDGDKEGLDISEFQFGMELEAAGETMPSLHPFSPLMGIVYPPFVGESEVIQMEEDIGTHAMEMSQGIQGLRVRLADTEVRMQGEAERIAAYVDSNLEWMMDHISILHCCGKQLQEAVGEVALLNDKYLYPPLTNRVYDLVAQVEDLQIKELVEDIEVMDADIKLHIPVLPQGVKTLGCRVQALEHTPAVVGLSTTSVITNALTGAPLISIGELLSKVGDLEQAHITMQMEVHSQGGASFGSHVFTSMSVLEAVIWSELPGGLGSNRLMCYERSQIRAF